MTTIAGSQQSWDEERKELRREEVRTGHDGLRVQRLTVRIQALALSLALVASLAAAYAAHEAGQAVKASVASDARQAAESQLTTAISALGGATPAQRVAGLTLLRINVATQVNEAASQSNTLTRQDAYDAYVTSLSVLGTYIRTKSPANSPVATTGPSSFGLGYGIPPVQPSIDLAYAADELQLLLAMKPEVSAIAAGARPAIDLSYDELYGLSLRGIQFNWLSTTYMLQVDMRMSNLSGSSWSNSSFLVHSYLQCADLSDADFRGANLTGADLRGSNVSGADFVGAILKDAKLDGVYGTAKGLKVVNPASTWNQESCGKNRQYWDFPKHT